MHFDLTDLRLFLNTTESGSITAGAARGHLALASASARLRGLEASLGTALLSRGRRGVQATAAGQALAYRARSLLQHVDRMQEEIWATTPAASRDAYGCCAIPPPPPNTCRSHWAPSCAPIPISDV